MFRHLVDAGYEVAWFGKNDAFGCETFRDSVTYHDSYRRWLSEGARNAFAPGEPGYYSFLYEEIPGTLDDMPDAACVEAGVRFLRCPHEQPFCLFLPLVLPHCPYAMPAPYHEMYDPEDLPQLRPAELPGKPSYHRLMREARRLDETPEWVFRKLNAVYCGMITGLDALLGRVLDVLDEAGLAENTTVLVFADHGDWAGDYGLVEKWSNALDDCLMHVPFIIRTPGGQAGHVVQEQVEIFDQMATILELAGVEARHDHFARSLVPQLHGEAGDPERAVFGEGGFDLFEPQCFEADPTAGEWSGNPEGIYYPKCLLNHTYPLSVCRSVMIRTLTHKLARRPASGEHELYDLQADPQELHNVHDEPGYADVRRELGTRLLDWYIRTADVTPPEKDSRGMPERSVYWRCPWGR